MTAADLPAADRLREQAGWNQTLADWQRLIGWQPEGCFVAEHHGAIVASTTTTPFGDAAYIGMLLVDQTLRRQGLGRTMLSYALDWLDSRAVLTVVLDATPLGKTLYDTAGFVDLYTLQRQHAIAPDVCADGMIALRPEHLPRLAELDARAFLGLDRLHVLRDLQAAQPSGCWLAEDGYVLSRPGAQAWFIGPLVAQTPATAEKLLRAALQPLSGQPVILDTVDANPHSGALARDYGFSLRRAFIRMARGAALKTGHTETYFASAGPEIG